jgi:hypothetical protein
MTDQREPKQRTQPKKGKPVEIPVPKRGDVERLLNRAAKQPAKQRRAPMKPPPQRHQRSGR